MDKCIRNILSVLTTGFLTTLLVSCGQEPGTYSTSNGSSITNDIAIDSLMIEEGYLSNDIFLAGDVDGLLIGDGVEANINLYPGNSNVACEGSACFCSSYTDVESVVLNQVANYPDEYLIKDNSDLSKIISFVISSSVLSLDISEGLESFHSLVESGGQVDSVTLCCKNDFSSWSISTLTSQEYSGVSGSVLLRSPLISGKSAFSIKNLNECDIFEVNSDEFNSVGIK